MTDILARFSDLKVIVAGDIILDEYVFGAATRMSREAPIPVLEFTERRSIAGGASNPAMNVAALGAQVAQIGVVGADAAGEELRRTLSSRGVDISGILTDPDRPTTLKQRIMAQMGLRFPQQVARIDTLSRVPISDAVAEALMAATFRLMDGARAVLFSDYRNGMLTPQFIEAVCARAGGLLLTADAQGDFLKYTGLGIVKCNADEAAAFLRRELVTDDDFAAAARELTATLRLTRGMVITRGPDGATIADSGGSVQRLPAGKVEDVFDTVGAGDTAIAVLTLAAAAGASLAEAAHLANVASSIVIRRVGNYAPSRDEIRAALK